VQKISGSDWRIFFQKAADNPALLNIADSVFTEYLSSDELTLDKIIEDRISPPAEKVALPVYIDSILKEKADSQMEKKQTIRFYMGKLMKSLAGLIPGSELNNELIRTLQMKGEQL